MRTWVQGRLRVCLVLAIGLTLVSCASHNGGKAKPMKGREGRPAASAPQRYGSIIGLKPEKLQEYKDLHAHAWPGVLKTIRECNIRNYSIYLIQLHENEYYLFSYFEYIGKDFDADMAKMAADPVTQDWWKLCIPCQAPLPSRAEGEWWASMEEVFHTD